VAVNEGGEVRNSLLKTAFQRQRSGRGTNQEKKLAKKRDRLVRLRTKRLRMEGKKTQKSSQGKDASGVNLGEPH